MNITNVTPYILFNGNCEEAVTFYQSILGGKIDAIKYDQFPRDEDVAISEHWKNKIMHCSLTFDNGNAIYFSDTWEEYLVEKGNNSNIHINVDSEQDVYEVVAKLSQGGDISMQAEKTFWGSVYGALQDTFGICWGIEYVIPSS